MQSTPAEVARTLAAGRLCGRLNVSAVPDGIPVAHATTVDGDVLIAARCDSRAWLSLRLNGSDQPAVLAVEDSPPFEDSPPLGLVRVGGWVTPVAAPDLRAAGIRFAEANPIDDLLDLGHGVDLFRLEPGEIRWEHGDAFSRIEPDEFAAASPDPLHADERDLLQDLRDHHRAELAALVPGPATAIQPVRLDRHGLTVTLPELGRLARLEFAHPACGPCCVARSLRLNHATGHQHGVHHPNPQ